VTRGGSGVIMQLHNLLTAEGAQRIVWVIVQVHN
jgi:hypothetical protein